MGLNDNIHTISKSIISEKQERIEARERKDFLKECQNELKALLLNMLIEEKKDGTNIYLDTCKDYLINDALTTYINSQKNKYLIDRLEKNYKKDLQHFLILNYYTICGTAEKIAKKQVEDVEDYKKQIAIERWNLQRQKMQLQIEGEKQKNTYKSQKEAERIYKIQTAQRQKIVNNTAKISNNLIVTVIKIFLGITFAPLLIMGFLLIGFLNGMGGRR